MKKKYITPTITKLCLEHETPILVGSVNTTELKTIDFNVETDDYESKNSNWDHISFE